MVVVDLNLPCAVSARFTYHWWWVRLAVLASPFTMDTFTCLAYALMAIAAVLQVIKAIPCVEKSAFIAITPNNGWLVFPNIPHCL